MSADDPAKDRDETQKRGELVLDIREKVREFIIRQRLYGEAGRLNDSDSFLEKGIVDSTGILEVISFLEQAFAVIIPDEELLPENLDSVDRIVDYMERKLA